MTRLAPLLLALSLSLATSAGAEIVPDGDCAGVYWDLSTAYESGDRIYARVLLTRAGPGDLNAAALGHWIDPDGVVTQFQNGRLEGSFALASPGPRLRIGSTSLDFSSARRLFEIDNDKRGVKIRIDWEAEAPDAAPRRQTSSESLSISALDVSRAAVATVWRRGVQTRALRGFATLVRTRHSVCEREVAAWRVDVHRLAARGWLLVHQQLVSGSALSFLDAPGSAGAEPAVAFEGWQRADGAHPLPSRMRANGGVFGSIDIGATRLSIDPLEALPRLVRMLYWFGAQPRRIWTDASSNLAWSAGLAALGDPPADLANGAAIATFTFLHPPDDPNLSPPPDSGG